MAEGSPLRVFCKYDPAPPLAFLFDTGHFVRTDEPGAEVIMHPELFTAKKNSKRELAELIKGYRSGTLSLMIFAVDDFEKSYRLQKNLVLLRTSARASKLQPNEILLPYIFEPPSLVFSPSVPAEKPRAGFCGLPSRPRRKMLRTFDRSSAVETNYILRNKFWGGNPHDPVLVEEYYRNMEQNTFILCNRGNGNFSIRFYQTLAAGRIPVVVNTDMPLPFADRIDWTKHIIFEKSEKDCLKKVIEAHRTGLVQKMEEANAALYREYFSFENFPAQVVPEIKKLINS